MLTEKKLESARLQAEGHKIIDISKKIGISRQSISAWQKDSEYQDAIKSIQKDMITNARHRLVKKTDSYLDELEKIALNSDNEKTKLSALTYLLDQSLGKATGYKEINVAEDKKESLSWDDMGKVVNLEK